MEEKDISVAFTAKDVKSYYGFLCMKQTLDNKAYSVSKVSNYLYVTLLNYNCSLKFYMEAVFVHKTF